MAADQRRKRLNGASIVSFGSREQHKTKRKNSGLLQSDLSMKSHISVEWDGNQKRVVAKREQIGISWRQMKPFVNFVSDEHKVLADVFAIPQEIFDLDNLSEVLSFEVWKTHLSESERNLLMHFLPRGLEPHQVVEELLAGDNFHFGNPFFKWGASLCLGDLHPDMIVDREQHLKSDKRAYYSQLHDYHNDMIGFLINLKERWESCKDPEKEIVQKIWRSKNDVEKRMPSNVNEYRVYDHDENVTATSESCSWDAEEKVSSSDNQISSMINGDKHQRRVLDKGFVKGKHRDLMVSSDDMLNVGARPKKGDKLQKRTTHSNDGDKYMSCIKISKHQHELVKSMKQSGKSIQSRSLNRVLGNLDNIHVQPYEVFIKEEQKKLQEHWWQLVNKDLPAAYANWTERQIQRYAVRNSLVEEVKDKSKPLLEDEDNVSSGSELQDQDEDEVLNDQSSSKDDEDSIARSWKNQSPHSSYLSGDDEFNPMSMDSEKNLVLSKSDDVSQNKDEFSRTMNTQGVPIGEGTPFASGDVWQAVEMPHSYYPVNPDYTTDRLSLENPQVNEEQQTCPIDLESRLRQEETGEELLQRHPPANPQVNEEKQTNIIDLDAELHQKETGKELLHRHPLENPQVNEERQTRLIDLDAELHQEEIGKELIHRHPQANPQLNEEQRTHLLDLDAELCQEERGKELFPRQSDDGTCSSYQSQDRTGLLQSLFKGEAVLSYHHEQKVAGLDFQTSNNVMVGDGQFSNHFKEPLQTTLTLDQGQRRANEVYMPGNMSQNIYSDGGRYLIPRQDPLSAVDMTDWAIDTARMAEPSESHLNTGDIIGQHWFPADHQVRGGWNGSDGGSLSSPSLGSGGNSDQSLFSVLSQCNQLRSGSPYDSVRHTDQFLTPRTYGIVDAATPRINAVVPQASHPLDYFSGRETPSALVPDDMGWMSLPPPSSALHDQTGKPYLRSWNR